MVESKQVKILKEFSGSTSIAGLSHIEQDSKWRTAFWIFAFLFCMIAFIVHFGVTVGRYYTYPKSTSMVQSPSGFIFPDITICPTLSFVETKYNDSKIRREYQRLFQFWKHSLNLSDKFENDMKIWETVDLSVIPRIFTRDIYPTVDDQVMYCSYMSKSCPKFYFKTFYHPKKLQCLHYNAPKRQLSSAGAKNGLHLVLNVANLIAFLSGTDEIDFLKGFEIQIHPEKSQPTFTHNTALLGVATQTNIELTMSKTEDVSTPVDPCNEEVMEDKIVKEGSIKTNKVKYQTFNRRLDDCRDDLLQRLFQKKCKCFDSGRSVTQEMFIQSGNYTSFCLDLPDMFYHNEKIFTNPATKKVMIKYNSNDYDFYEELRKTNITDRWKCFEEWTDFVSEISLTASKCYNPCSKIFYSQSLEVNQWPSDPEHLKRFLNDSAEEQRVKPKWFGKPIDTNKLLSVKIYANDLGIRIYEQGREFDIAELWSEFGGVSGLWIGVCIMTAFEILELFILLGCSCCSSKKNKAPNREEDIKMNNTSPDDDKNEDSEKQQLA